MELSDWPLYVNDYGVIYCDASFCPSEGEHIFAGIGRHVTVGKLLNVISKHIEQDHKDVDAST